MIRWLPAHCVCTIKLLLIQTCSCGETSISTELLLPELQDTSQHALLHFLTNESKMTCKHFLLMMHLQPYALCNPLHSTGLIHHMTTNPPDLSLRNLKKYSPIG